jgi:type I restriction enzyme S subunit
MSFPRYENYKDSGVEWLGEVPEHWDVRAIKHIVSIPITDGPHETPNFPDEGIPFVSAEAVSTGVIDFSKIRGFISESDHFRYSQKYLPQFGDIYMVKSGATTGITAIVEVDREFNIWSPLAAIRCGKRAIPRFILNFMRSKNFQEAVTLNWSFGTQQNIGMGVIENLAVTLPPIPEQQTIAAFLDCETAKIDALITEQQRLIELLKEKRQAVISHAVTKGLNPSAPMKDSGVEWLGKVPEHWTISALKQKVKMRYGDALASEIREEGDVEVFGSNGRVGSHCLANTKVPAIVVGRKGSYGKIVWAEKGGFVIDTAYAIDSDTTGLDLRWVYYWLQPLGLDSLSQDTGVPGLAREKAYEMRIVVPPLSEQQTIATFLDRETAKLDTLTAEAKTAITLLQERRTALISAAVTGKIDVRGLVSAKTEVKAETVPC